MKNAISIGVRKINNGYIATFRTDDVTDPKVPAPPQKNEKSEKSLAGIRKHINTFLDKHLVQK
jgi:hypothetical protein